MGSHFERQAVFNFLSRFERFARIHPVRRRATEAREVRRNATSSSLIGNVRTGDAFGCQPERIAMAETRVFTTSDLQTAVAVAVKRDRARVASILAAPEASGRAELALTLATTTDKSVSEARSALAAAPIAGARDRADASPCPRRHRLRRTPRTNSRRLTALSAPVKCRPCGTRR